MKLNTDSMKFDNTTRFTLTNRFSLRFHRRGAPRSEPQSGTEENAEKNTFSGFSNPKPFSAFSRAPYSAHSRPLR